MSPLEIEAMGRAMLKLGGDDRVPNPKTHAGLSFGAGVAGIASGVGLGVAAAHGASKLYERAMGHPVPVGTILPAAALIATAGATAYNTYKTLELEELQRAFRSWQQSNKPGT